MSADPAYKLKCQSAAAEQKSLASKAAYFENLSRQPNLPD